MASRLLLRPLLRPAVPLTLVTGFTTASILFPRQPLRCDYRASIQPSSNPFQQVKQESRSYLSRNRSQIRQISTGSVTGLVTGLTISFFSKPLALLIGLFIAGLYALEASGIHLIPYQRIQKYVTNYDVKSAVSENLPLKMSFGLACSLSAFGSF